MCPLENCSKEYLYFSSLKKHLARNHTKLFWEKYARWSKDEIVKEKEELDDIEEESENIAGEESKISPDMADITKNEPDSPVPSDYELAQNLFKLWESFSNPHPLLPPTKKNSWSVSALEPPLSPKLIPDQTPNRLKVQNPFQLYSDLYVKKVWGHTPLMAGQYFVPVPKKHGLELSPLLLQLIG